MEELMKALLNLNAAFMMQGYNSDFSITLEDRDFDRFVTDFENKHQKLISYPDLNPVGTLRDVKTVKIAGPGSYFIVKRRA